MPKAGKIIDNQQKVIPKTERMVYLPRSYNIRDKTERMVDLPAIIENYNEPKLITSNLIYFLDGVGYTIKDGEWYDSITKTSSSKASPYNISAGYTSPLPEYKSIKLTSSTNPLLTSLSSDDFSNPTGFYTVSIYVKINGVITTPRGFLVIQNNATFGSSHVAIFQMGLTPAISFRSTSIPSYRYTIEYNKPYMFTIIKNNDFFYYYINDDFFLSEPTSNVTPRSTSGTSPIVLGNTTNSQPFINCYGLLVYNRVLTQSEISNNYDHLKARYGSTTSNSAYNIPSVIP